MTAHSHHDSHMPARPCRAPVVTGVPGRDGRLLRRAWWVLPGWAAAWEGVGVRGGSSWALARVSPPCPSIPPPAERRWRVPLCHGLAAEWGPAVRPGSWPGSTGWLCRQCLGWSREDAVMPCRAGPSRGAQGWPPRGIPPGAALLAPAMGCEGGGRRGWLICLCQEPVREPVPLERSRDGAARGAQHHPMAPLACGTACASTTCRLRGWQWRSGLSRHAMLCPQP